MTQQHPSRFSLLLLLALTALAGCDPKPTPPTPPAEQPYTEVQFDVTVPPETPVEASVFIKGSDPSLTGASNKGLELIFQGGNVYSGKTRLPKRTDITYTVQLGTPQAQVALDAAGAVVSARTLRVEQDEEKVSLTVERWGPATGDTQARTVFLVAVPETTAPDASIYLSGNAAELGGGKPDGVKLYKAMNSRYATVLAIAPGTALAFKVTRGTVETEAKGARGEDIASHTHQTGSGLQRVEVSVARWADMPSALTFKVTVPPETPADAKVVLKGAHAVFGGATGAGLELTYESGTTFSASVSLARGAELAFATRLTQPSAQVELDMAGAVRPSRTLKVKGDETLNVLVERWGPETGGSTAPQLVFVVTVPGITPANSTLWLAGNRPELGGWPANGSGVQLSKVVGGRYATTVSFPTGSWLEYKVTRGSWGTVEKGPGGEEIGNRTYTTKSGYERIFATVARWADIDSLPPVQGVLTGNIEYLREVTPSNTLLRKRDVIIWLPPDYTTNSTRRYPVLYMHDGQNLMDASTAYAGEWGVDETAQQLVQKGEVAPVIIVGVYNTANRGPEYTQVPDDRYPEVDGANGGRADLYGQFLINELKPMIDGKYRTLTDAANTGMAGSSLGGLVTMYLGMKNPGTFSRLGVVSPSVFWANSNIVTQVNALPGKLPLRIWLDIGTNEGSSSQETVEDTQALRDALVGKGWVLDNDLKYTEVPGGVHNEAAWAARFGDILKYLYPPVSAQ
jgi:predicted alpha/beta superfamily hydrolase